MNHQEQMYTLVEQWRESGLSKGKFCTTRHISLHQFNYWIKKQNKASLAENPIRELDFFSLSHDQSTEKSTFKALRKQTLCIELPNGTKISFY